MTSSMPRRYTREEVQRHEPAACKGCGRRLVANWVDVTRASDPEPMYSPTKASCHTVGFKYGPRI